MTVVDYTDAAGYPRRAEVPAGALDPEQGVPLAADWEALDLPEPLRLRLAAECIRQGLVAPADFVRPGALKRIVAALQAALKIDANTVQAVLSGRAAEREETR